MSIGFLRQDDASHWYLIPEEKLAEFSMLMEHVYNNDSLDACDLVNEHFDKYRLSGGPENLPIYISDRD